MSDLSLGTFQTFPADAAFGLLCAIGIGLFIIFLLIAIWVYRDAESRGMSGVLWLLVVLIGGIIGLIVYLVVRKDKVPTMVPPAYGPGWVVPPPEGPSAPTGTQTTCRQCGTPLEPGATFCSRCGAKV